MLAEAPVVDIAPVMRAKYQVMFQYYCSSHMTIDGSHMTMTLTSTISHNQPSLESVIFGISHAAHAGARDNMRMWY